MKLTLHHLDILITFEIYFAAVVLDASVEQFQFVILVYGIGGFGMMASNGRIVSCSGAAGGGGGDDDGNKTRRRPSQGKNYYLYSFI